MNFAFFNSIISDNILGSILLEKSIELIMEACKKFAYGSKNRYCEDYSAQFFGWIVDTTFDTCKSQGIKCNRHQLMDDLVVSRINDYDKYENNNYFECVLNELLKSEITDTFKEKFTEFAIRNLSSSKYTFLRNYYSIHSIINTDSMIKKAPVVRHHVNNDLTVFLDNYKKRIFWGRNNNYSLERLYTPNTFEFKTINSDTKLNIEIFLNEFCYNEDFDLYLQNITNTVCYEPSIIIVSGDLGCGKTSLISKIAFDFSRLSNKDNDVELFFIDLSKYQKKLDCLIDEIYEFEIPFNKRIVFILDGLDEVSKEQNYCQEFFNRFSNIILNKKCKAIITTRPYMISPQNLYSSEISMCSFDIDNAFKWLEKYNIIDENFKLEDWKGAIKNIDEKLTRIILNPLILYICVIRNIEIKSIESIGDLYDEIFGESISYIATPIYKNNESIPIEEWKKTREYIKDISVKMFKQQRKEIKIDTDKSNNYIIGFGVNIINHNNSHYLSFAHTSINEYFVAETIYEMLNTINTNSREFWVKFKHIMNSESVLNDSIYGFITHFIKKNSLASITIHQIYDIIYQSINMPLSNKDILNGIHGSINKLYLLFLNIIKTLYPNIIYQFAKNIYLQAPEQFILICNACYENPMKLFYKMNFENVCFERYSFVKANLIASILRKSKFLYCNFNHSYLNSSYAYNSDFSYCSFESSSLKNANFSNSVLRCCSFKNAELNGADFSHADLSYSDLRGASIQKTKFENACLNNSFINFEQMEYIRLEIVFDNNIQVFIDGKKLSFDEIKLKYKEKYGVRYALWSKETLY